MAALTTIEIKYKNDSTIHSYEIDNEDAIALEHYYGLSEEYGPEALPRYYSFTQYTKTKQINIIFDLQEVAQIKVFRDINSEEDSLFKYST